MSPASTAFEPPTRWRRPFVVLAWVAVSMALVPAQTHALDPGKAITQFVHRKWGAADGIGPVRWIAQTNDGYIWVAASNGLFRLDGATPKRWEPAAGDPALPANILNLHVSRDGSLWMLSADTACRLHDGHLTTYGSKEAFIGGRGTSIFEGPDGAIWVGTQKGLSRFANNRWEKIGPERGCPEGWVGAPCVDKKGTIWLFSGKEGRSPTCVLLSLAPGEKRFQTAEGGCPQIMATVEGLDGRLWTADFSPARGVGPIQPGRTKIEDGHPMIHVGSQSFLFDRDGGLWITTVGDGLRRARDVVKLENKDVAQFGDEVDKFTEKDGLSSDVMGPIFEDREGSIWTGTTAGLDCFCETKFTALSVPEGLPFDDRLMVQAARDGSIWIGTAAGGFAQLRKGETRFTNRHWLDVKPKRSWAFLATAIYPDPSGDLFLGTGMGLVRVHDDVGELPTTPSVDKFITVVVMARDNSGQLVIGDLRQGLFVWNGEKISKLPLDGINVDMVSAVFNSRSKGLWVGSFHGGVVGHRHGDEKEKFYSFTAVDGLFEGTVRQIFEDANADMWVIGVGGLSRWQGGRFQTLDRRNGLPEEDLYSAIVDDSGAFWLVGATGIFRVTAAELNRVLAAGVGRVQGRYFDYNDGLRGYLGFHEWGGNGAAKTPDGKLWFATNKGLAVIDPRHIPSNPIPPPVWIQSIKAGGKNYNISGTLSFPPDTRNCEFQYVAPSFIDPEKVRYRYRLEGFDKDWVEAEKRREAFYSNLRSGKYRFRVIACNNDGVWNEAGSSVAFSIQPAFYETVWFLMLCVASLALGLWGWHRLRLARLTRGLNLRLEVQQQERKRIAQELHDTLLQGFAGVGLKLEAIATQLPESLGPTRNTIHAILDDSDRYLAEARRAVWALRSSSFAEGNDFSTALSQACGQLLQGSGIQFDFQTNGTPRPLSTAVEDNLLRVCQEATTNAIKHAKASRISVSLDFEDREVRVSIGDNGCGFALDEAGAVKAGHFGLAGIRERVEMLGGTISVRSQKGQGTEITATIKTDQDG